MMDKPAVRQCPYKDISKQRALSKQLFTNFQQSHSETFINGGRDANSPPTIA